MKSEKELEEWEAGRDIWQETLDAVREMKAGKAGRIHKVEISPVAEARFKSGLSQSAFAKLLGVSKRTLQEWEQGRRKPSGAASALLKIAEKRPDVLREVLA